MTYGLIDSIHGKFISFGHGKPIAGHTSNIHQDIIAFSDFEDGTFGPFSVSGIGLHLDELVVPDPTGAGKGNVAQIHYSGSGDPATGGDDVDRAFFIDSSPGVGFGQTIYSKSDVYIPSEADLSNLAILRKIFYWQGLGSPRYFYIVLHLVGNSMRLEWVYTKQDNINIFDFVTPFFATIINNHWYTIEMWIKLPSAIGVSDASFIVNLDGSNVYTNTTIAFSDPAWTIDVTQQNLTRFLIGEQVDVSGSVFNENRYFDNVTLTKIY